MYRRCAQYQTDVVKSADVGPIPKLKKPELTVKRTAETEHGVEIHSHREELIDICKVRGPRRNEQQRITHSVLKALWMGEGCCLRESGTNDSQ